MAVLSLPLTFTNSFWSQDYRKGLQVLFQKLEQGCAENEEIINLIRSRAHSEGVLASSLINVYTGSPGTGFSADEGASLLAAFRGLQAESAAQGNVHKSIANELTTLVADPFEDWAQNYKDRLLQRKVAVLDNWLKSYEHSQFDVNKLKNTYLSKTRKADEAEDDVKFAPTSHGASDSYTTSPRTRPVDGRAPPHRSASVSERIAQRLKEIQKKSAGALASEPVSESQSTLVAEPESIEDAKEKVDKGKGKALEDSPELVTPPPMSPLPPPKTELRDHTPPPAVQPQPVLLAGLAFPPAALSNLLTRASHELKLRPVRFPLLGEYQDAFNGEEFVAWLNDNVPGFGGSLDRAEDAARELTEREGLLRRLGELGNQFEHSDDAFYQFRAKAFNLGRQDSISSEAAGSPIKSENLLKRTNNFVNLVSQALKANPNGAPVYIRMRHEAEEADKVYRSAVRRLDRQRLTLEEKLEDTLKTMQRWETERLRAVKTVLLQYQGTLANLPKGLESSIERSATLVASYQPESDLSALIERYRTGPFRPDPQVYESVSHEEYDVVFGIDLRRWADSTWNTLAGEEQKDKDQNVVPPVITALLEGLTQAYERLPNDSEKRKSWIYEVPLTATHHLRETLNALPPEEPIPLDVFTKYDAPVIASAIKLWILELDPPLALYEGWDDIRKLYPTVGSKKIEDDASSEEQRIKDLCTALQKLPRIHLYVFNVFISHLKKLIESTKAEESDEVYITKLALSIGRAILRPKQESQLSVQDRHPSLFFMDLMKQYDNILPPTIARKKRESERKIPVRKRTAMVDMRMSRSRISDVSPEIQQQLLAAQKAAQLPSKNPKSPEIPPPVPQLPPSVAAPVVAPPPPPPSEKTQSSAPAEIVAPPPPPPPLAPDVPKPPVFKEPPPELDDLPPRPQFKEPPPEPDDDAAPPRPKFADPPPEESEIPSAGVISPSQTSPTANLTSRSPSPTVSDGGKVKTGAIIRGPRITRGPRTQGGAVQSMVSNINRNSVGSSSPRSGSPTSPTYKRLSGTGSPPGHNRRPSSVLGRSSAFSRRTMASDAEDDVVDKK